MALSVLPYMGLPPGFQIILAWQADDQMSSPTKTIKKGGGVATSWEKIKHSTLLMSVCRHNWHSKLIPYTGEKHIFHLKIAF